MAELTAFLQAQRREVFDWRSAHCLRLPAEWISSQHGLDLVTAWPDPPTDEAGALAYVERCGGVTAMMAAALDPRFGRAADLQPGDVGAVERLTSIGPAVVGAIWCGRRWVSRARTGLWFGSGDALAAWATR